MLYPLKGPSNTSQLIFIIKNKKLQNTEQNGNMLLKAY